MKRRDFLKLPAVIALAVPTVAAAETKELFDLSEYEGESHFLGEARVVESDEKWSASREALRAWMAEYKKSGCTMSIV